MIVKTKKKYKYYDNEGVKVGVLKYKILWNQIPFIETLYVEPDHRNKKYGTMLIMSFIKDFQEYEEILISYEKSNVNAERLYHRLGFKKSGSITWLSGYQPENFLSINPKDVK